MSHKFKIGDKVVLNSEFFKNSNKVNKNTVLTIKALKKLEQGHSLYGDLYYETKEPAVFEDNYKQTSFYETHLELATKLHKALL